MNIWKTINNILYVINYSRILLKCNSYFNLTNNVLLRLIFFNSQGCRLPFLASCCGADVVQIASHSMENMDMLDNLTLKYDTAKI